MKPNVHAMSLTNVLQRELNNGRNVYAALECNPVIDKHAVYFGLTLSTGSSHKHNKVLYHGHQTLPANS